MTWKTKPSSINAKTAERRLRTISQLRDLCLSLAEAKKRTPLGPVFKFPPTTDAGRAVLQQLEREANAASETL